MGFFCKGRKKLRDYLETPSAHPLEKQLPDELHSQGRSHTETTARICSAFGIAPASPAGLSRASPVLKYFPILSAASLSQRRSHWKELGLANIFCPVLHLHLTNHEGHLATITKKALWVITAASDEA